jgi:hypothetical protein
MYIIDPITEESCKPHYGKEVLIFLQDGTEIYGVMNRVENGKLFLNDFSGSDLSTTQTSKKRKVTRGKKSSQKSKVNSSAGAIALEPATIALLFAVLI